MNWFFIFIFAGLGGLCRYGIAVAMNNYTRQFPFHTLVANIVSCFILGLLYFYLSEKIHLSENWRLGLAVGFCGGFSTFSTFTLDTYKLFSNGSYALGFGNIILNIGFSMLGLLLAALLFKKSF